MKKRIIAITAALMMFAAPAMAQIFIDDVDEFNGNRAGTGTSEMNVYNPDAYGNGTDYYAPVGEGIVLLAGLAGAYLVGNRRKEE